MLNPAHLQDEDLSMFALVEGSGPETVVLIHGYPCSSFDYNRALPLLASDFRVVLFDLPGYGFSDKPNGVKLFRQVFPVIF